MADIFISYKREDRRFAERLSISLEQLGFDVWWDFELLSGDQFRRVIEKVIDQCSATLVLWSNLSRDSTFVVDEASYAKEQNKLCPARIDDCRLPLGFGGDHVIDLRGWDGEMQHEGLQTLLRSLEAKTGKKARLGARARDADDEARYREMEAFKAAQSAQNASALRAFLRDYPNGAFSNFVRGQVDEMGASAPAQAAAVAPGLTLTPPPQRPHSPPQGELPLPHSSPVHGGGGSREARDGGGDEKKSPWPLLAGAAIAVALLAVVVALRPWEQGAPVTQAPAITEAPRDVDAEIEAARRAERERVLAEQAAREQQLREQGLAEQAARDQAAREQAARDQAARDQAALEQAARDQRAREQADDAAWGVAQRANSVAGYDAYLASYPSGRHAGDARSARQRVQAAATPSYGAYDLAQLHPDVRRAAEQARAAESRANAAAARARQDSANGLVLTFPSGQGFEGEAGEAPHLGAWHDASGNTYAGRFTAGRPGYRDGYGVYRWGDGFRYEGEWGNDDRSGYGVLWNAQGRVISQGIWTDDSLSTPLSR